MSQTVTWFPDPVLQAALPRERRAPGVTGDLVMQTIIDLHAAGRMATRQVVVEITQLSYAVVDDHIKRAIDDGKLRRVAPGIVEPVEQLPPARAISLTRLPNGMGKLEIGEHVVDLVPSEERQLGSMLAGRAAEMTGIQNARDLADMVAHLQRQLEAVQRRAEAQDETIRRLQKIPKQDELF
ncbi:hypothetical protein EJP67_16540 [Variovorax guangxiensis]|uniref:Uncharacterized protein n=1 Tax=Variovorax guangxiensis TaxID=1775474 RepID=A0A433MKU1_9BURK|nr:hypothetical protein [Variovorax guangxiensis]RUR68671.1 hypothetical protein EJP67_16540 [Variovorax guangxiensis]